MRSDARKRLHPEPLAHPDPSVRELIKAARDQGRIEGWGMARLALEAEFGAPEGVAFIKALVNAWDCCGTCAGGVLAAHDRAIAAEVHS